MADTAITLTFFFDFLCPFAYRTSIWIDKVKAQLGEELDLRWRYFSLEQVNTPAESSWKIWEQDEGYTNPQGWERSRGLLAFWAAEAARRQGHEAFDRFRAALYHARHRDQLDFGTRAAIEPIAEAVGLDMQQFHNDFRNPELRQAIRHDHQYAAMTYRAFGVPTLAYDEDNAIYLKLTELPPDDDTVPLFNELLHSFTRRRWLSEIKRPNP